MSEALLELGLHDLLVNLLLQGTGVLLDFVDFVFFNDIAGKCEHQQAVSREGYEHRNECAFLHRLIICTTRGDARRNKRR